MFYDLYVVLAIFTTILAVYFDLKTRIIPRELTMGLLGLALSLHFLESGMLGNPWPFINSVLSALIAYVVLYLAWKLGVIAGGDAKLLIALNALLVQLPNTFSWINKYHLVFLPILWNGIIAVTPLLVVYTGFRLGKKSIDILVKNLKSALGYSFLIYSVFSFYSGTTAWLIFFVLFFLPYKWLILAIPGIATALQLGWDGLFTTFAFVLAFSLFFDLLFSGKKLFREKKKTSELHPGDVLAEIVVDGKRVEYNFWNFIRYLGRGIVPLSRGLTEGEIKELRKLGVKEVWVQKSVPFTPIILLGLIVSIFLGDMLWLGVK